MLWLYIARLDFEVFMEAYWKIIGCNIKRVRKENKLTQNELAKRIKISTVHMSHIEGGSVSMSLSLFLKLCEELHVSADTLLENAYDFTDKNDLQVSIDPECQILCTKITDLIKESFTKKQKMD